MKYLNFILLSILASGVISAKTAVLTYNEYYDILQNNDIQKLEELKKRGMNLNQYIDQNSLLSTAAARNYKITKWLIDNGADVNLKNTYDGTTPLMTAVTSYDSKISFDIINYLIQNNADANILDNDENNCLMKLSSNYSWKDISPEMYDLILSKTNNINQANKNKDTALINACRNNNEVLALKIIEKGADVNSRNNEGLNALGCLIHQNNPDILAEKLIQKGIDINLSDEYNESLIFKTIRYYNKENHILDLLLNNKVNINVVNKDGYSPLQEACQNENIPAEIITRLIVNKNILNSTAGYEKISAAHFAVDEYDGNINAIPVLIKAGADLNIKNLEGENVLIAACKNSKITENLMQLIINNTTDINFQNNSKNSALHVAVQKNDFKKTALLVKNKASVNLKNIDGSSPLHIAVEEYDSYETINFLIKNGADINAVNIDNQTPLILCYAENNIKGAQVLLKNGADFTIPDNKKNNIFHYAASGSDPQYFEIIMKKNLLINSQNIDGNTPLHISFYESQFDTAEYLMKNGANPLITNIWNMTALDWALTNPKKYTVNEIAQNEFLNDYFRNDAAFSEKYLKALNDAENYKKQSERTEAMYNFKRAAFFLVPPAIFMASSIYFREFTYSDNPMDNNFAYVNSVTACTIAGGVLGGFLGAICTSSNSDGWKRLGGIIIGAAAGTATGFVSGFFVADEFKDNRFLYYSAPAVFCIAMPVIVYNF